MLIEKKNGDEVEESNFTDTTIPEYLWTAVCGGDLDYVKKFPRETLKKARYTRFGSEHSLIIGAIRNSDYSVAKYLYLIGVRQLESERDEILLSLISKLDK